MITALDRPAVLAALRDARWNVGRAARKLGCARRTLQNRMRDYGIPRGRAGRPRRPLHYRKASGIGGALVGLAAVGAGVYVFSQRRKA